MMKVCTMQVWHERTFISMILIYLVNMIVIVMFIISIHLWFPPLTLLGRTKSNGFDGKSTSTSSSVNESTPISAKEARLKKILEEELVDPDKLMNKNKKQSRSMYDSNAKIVSKTGRSSYNTLDLRTTENLGKCILIDIWISLTVVVISELFHRRPYIGLFVHCYHYHLSIFFIMIIILIIKLYDCCL